MKSRSSEDNEAADGERVSEENFIHPFLHRKIRAEKELRKKETMRKEVKVGHCQGSREVLIQTQDLMNYKWKSHTISKYDVCGD